MSWHRDLPVGFDPATTAPSDARTVTEAVRGPATRQGPHRVRTSGALR